MNIDIRTYITKLLSDMHGSIVSLAVSSLAAYLLLKNSETDAAKTLWEKLNSTMLIRLPLWAVILLVVALLSLCIVPKILLAFKKGKRPNQILLLLNKSGAMSIDAIAESIGIEPGTAKYHLEKLEELVMVKTVQVTPPPKKSSGYKVPGYQIEPKGTEHLLSQNLINP